MSQNGKAGEGLSPFPVQRSLSQKEITEVFGLVPWMEFNVTAKPNLAAFSSNPVIRQVVADVAQSTVEQITGEVTESIMAAIQKAVHQAIKEATDAVPRYVMENMQQVFKDMTIAPDIRPLTDYQHLTINNIININDSSNIPDNKINTIDTHSGNRYDPNNTGGVTPRPVPVSSGPAPQAVANPDIAKGKWIWTQEQPYNQPPSGARAFRKTVTIPGGKKVDSMIIDITCDNFYTLYVNGRMVGSGTDWSKVQRYSIKFASTGTVDIAVYAAQDPVSMQQAGLISASVLWDSAHFEGQTYNANTDGTWRTSNTTDSGFQKNGFRETRDWEAARVEGDYGMQPWGTVSKPTVTSPLSGGFFNKADIPNPPSAPQATAGPGITGNTTL